MLRTAKMQTIEGDDGCGKPGARGAGKARRVPAHVGIIMDGNGRWAAARGMPRLEGHRRGVEALRAAVKSASDLGVRFLTVYSFSSENWTRPVEEVSDLMGLLKRFIRKDLADLHRNGVRVRIIGERARLMPDIRALLDEAEVLTAANDGLVLVVAFNYGSRRPRHHRARHRLGPPRHGRHPRSRPHHPDLGRTAPVELPDVAGRLR